MNKKATLATVLKLLPRSDEQLAIDIGISSKTIKRIKTGTYHPSETTRITIVDYLTKLNTILKDFIG